MEETYAQLKIASPMLPQVFLHRPSLVTALNTAVIGTPDISVARRSPYKVVLLCAPAGYGKTTLLAEFAEQAGIPCCWCFLDSGDQDKVKFLRLLVDSLSQHFPQFGSRLRLHIANVIAADLDGSLVFDGAETIIQELTKTIVAEIPEHFVLLLCNYHEINSCQAINTLLNLFIENLPPQCTLIIESRATPTLDFTSLLAHQSLFGLGSSDLKFVAHEIYELACLQGLGHFTETEAEQIAQSFDGWITGILLNTRLGDLQLLGKKGAFGTDWGAPAIRMDRQLLFAYLVNEVFSHVPDAYAFLKEAAFLEWMTPSLCNAFLEISDAARHLAFLEQQGLFVTRRVQALGQIQEPVYVCHPILRELFHEDLRNHDYARFVALHRRAIDCYIDNHAYDMAIPCAFTIQAHDLAATLLEHTYKEMFVTGYFMTLASWIDMLPDHVAEQHPNLLLVRAKLFLASGEYTKALPLLDTISAILEEHSNQAPTLFAEMMITRSAILFQQGNYPEAQKLCDQALTFLQEDEVALRTETYLRSGVIAIFLNDVNAGIVVLKKALQYHGHTMETRQRARLHNALANAYDLAGSLILSEYHRTCAAHCWESIHDEWGKIDNQVGWGFLKLHRGDFAEAEQILTEALRSSRGTFHYRRGEAYSLANLGELYLNQNLYQQALSAFEESFALARQIQDAHLMNTTAIDLASTYLLLGDTEIAQMIITYVIHTPASTRPLFGYELALWELAQGTVFLQRRQVVEALAYLTHAEGSFRQLGIKREHIQALLRLATCLLIQNERAPALLHVEEAILIARQYNYQPACVLELERFPELMNILQALPENSQVWTFLKEAGLDREQTVSLPYAGLPIEPVQEKSSAPTDTLSETKALIVEKSHVQVIDNLPLSVRLCAFGEPAVYVNGTLVTRWRMARTAELLFFLLDINRPAHKEYILASLWPEADEQAAQTLRTSIYHLRKILGAKCIISYASTYALDLPALYKENVWYDVATFRENYALAQQKLIEGDKEAAATALQAAIDLYRGDYVQSFYSDWSVPRRRELQQIHMDARHELALIFYEQHSFAECISHWQHLIAIDPCLEEAHYWLMRSYIQQGKRGLALRQYQHCTTSLKDELGIQPGEAIQTLYQEIIRKKHEQ